MVNVEENKVKVSVIIPVYNVEKYLKECLDSVANRNMEDILEFAKTKRSM